MMEILKSRKEQCDKMKYGQNIKLGDATRVTPINIQEVQASKLGDAQGIPFFINKNPRFLPNASFLLFHAQFCFSWSVFFFVFVLVFSLLALLSFLYKLVGPQHTSFGEVTPHSSLLRTLQFSLLLFCECSLLLALCLALVFFCFLIRNFQFFFVDL